jgi:hypothetical protein
MNCPRETRLGNTSQIPACRESGNPPHPAFSSNSLVHNYGPRAISAPEVLDTADRLGFLVIDGAFDTFLRAKQPNAYASRFADWSGKDLAMLVKRDRNHT